jgi:hypothetical protein
MSAFTTYPDWISHWTASGSEVPVVTGTPWKSARSHFAEQGRLDSGTLTLRQLSEGTEEKARRHPISAAVLEVHLLPSIASAGVEEHRTSGLSAEWQGNSVDGHVGIERIRRPDDPGTHEHQVAERIPLERLEICDARLIVREDVAIDLVLTHRLDSYRDEPIHMLQTRPEHHRLPPPPSGFGPLGALYHLARPCTEPLPRPPPPQNAARYRDAEWWIHDRRRLRERVHAQSIDPWALLHNAPSPSSPSF